MQTTISRILLFVIFFALAGCFGENGIHKIKIGIFECKNQSDLPMARCQKLEDTLNKLKYPAQALGEKQLDEFFKEPIEMPKLLILVNPGSISQAVRSKIDMYLAEGGDLLLIGDPSGGLTQDNPLGGCVGRYSTFETGRDTVFSSLLDRTAQFSRNELPDKLTFATAYPMAKSMQTDSLSSNFGRWINWFPAKTEQRTIPASIASSWIHGKKNCPDKVSIISHCGINDELAGVETLKAFLAPMLAFHQTGVTLLNAGPSLFHYSPDEQKIIGGRILNRTSTLMPVRVEIKLQRAGIEKVCYQKAISLNIPPGHVEDWKESIDENINDEGDYQLQIDVRSPAGDLIDRQRSRFIVSTLASPSTKEVVTISDGRFQLAGKPWFFRGIHYWLPQVVGQPDSHMWHEFLMPALYDPEEADSGLRVLADSGLNSVVIPYRDPREASACMDFLARCKKYNLKAMVFIENAHPLRFNLEKLDAMISEAALDKQPALFAMDLAWEPHLGNEEDRKVLNSDWRDWIIDQYGTVSNAESLWKFAVSSGGEPVRSPNDNELLEDGPWRIMVAAYRRFLDDKISLGYGKVTRAIKSRCRNMLVGARTGYGGTGYFGDIDRQVPFDLVSGADHLDYISPEAYGLGLENEWNSFLNGFLITEMARYAGRYKKPVVWMEYGKSAIPVGAKTWSAQELNLKYQADYFKYMSRLIDETSVDGAFAWWSVGGYRYDEKSDFGLLGVDGKIRPAFEILSRTGFHSNVTWHPDAWIEINRDLHPRGLSILLRDQFSEFMRLRNEGKRVGFKSPVDGMTTENFPLVGVGNVTSNRIGPIQGLNGEIYSLRSIGDTWNEISCHILNTGRVTWCSNPTSAGCVVLELQANGKVIAQKNIAADLVGGDSGLETIRFENPLTPNTYKLILKSERTGPFGSSLTFVVKK